MKILAISDQRLPEMLQQDYLRQSYGDAEMLISCGDMEASYLEFIASAINLPLFYVRGNHDNRYEPEHPGGENLHLNFQTYKGLTLVGLEGSPYYNGKNVQYSESRMGLFCLSLLPRMLLRRQSGRWGVDYLVTHSPPKGIHDREDRTHQGFASFLWLMRLGKPRYLIHGHVDVWDRREKTETQYFATRVININPKRLLIPEEDDKKPV
jgi:Icc-related predicted phosphoesterase